MADRAYWTPRKRTLTSRLRVLLGVEPVELWPTMSPTAVLVVSGCGPRGRARRCGARPRSQMPDLFHPVRDEQHPDTSSVTSRISSKSWSMPSCVRKAVTSSRISSPWSGQVVHGSRDGHHRPLDRPEPATSARGSISPPTRLSSLRGRSTDGHESRRERPPSRSISRFSVTESSEGTRGPGGPRRCGSRRSRRRGNGSRCSRTTRRRPCVRGVEPGQDLDKCRLAAAVLAEQANHLAGGDVEGDVVQHRPWAEGLGEVLYPDCRGCHLGCLLHCRWLVRVAASRRRRPTASRSRPGSWPRRTRRRGWH